ncbi:hypothetical protein AC482_01465 [miscellaneous Crenarchaeota group-15 archaeon DG-45]|uniref:DUF5658 domain-containing protein n=1 Tax=miscellaneous Crenarchaeota group-15 archaeon DG-45 TaxID=1685127 RepID=A0A0M0BRL7_9ARCH|nr:MAG: hypothetical protein AC482_01465 [miscellaneous Crenarchaeota group-15 archaeon DG-45]
MVELRGRSRSSEAVGCSMKGGWLWLAAMAVFVLGCVFDHLTTAYGLMLPDICELNMNVLFLMRRGLWHLSEMLVIMAGAGSGYLALKSRSNMTVNLSSLMLISAGLFRFYASMQNLSLILNVMM